MGNAETITISDGNGNSVVTTAENMSKVAKLVDSSLIQSIYEGSKEVYRDYEVTLTDAELVEILEETAALSAEIDEDKNELELLKTRATTLRKAIDEKLEKLSFELHKSRSKKARRAIRCWEKFYWATDAVAYINADTGEVMETLPIPEDRKQGKLEFEPSKNINICDDCKNIYNKCNTDGMITEQDEDDNTIKCNYYEAQAEQEEQGL